MEVVSRAIIRAMWLAFLVYWLVAARKVKSTRWREPLRSQLRHWVFFGLGAFFILPHPPVWERLAEPYMPYSPILVPIGAMIAAIGFGFAVWARLHLGGEWSDTVALKQEHSLVDTGPYGIVRHPIYSGLLLAFIGTAVSRDEWRCLMAVGLVATGFVLRCVAEEAKMRQALPEYDAYARRTKRIIPLIY